MPAGPALGILGTLELNGPAGPVRLGAAKERCLLAVLAVNGCEVVSRDRLVEALWGGVSPRSAVGALQNYVLRLRRVLRSIDGLKIVTAPGGYRLDAHPEGVDARLAERLVADGRAAAAEDDAAKAARLLGAAVALWRGPSLAEFADQAFATAEAARLDELRESAREDLVDAQLALGRHHSLSGELEAMVSCHPLRERRWAQLMLALYRDGRQAAALEAFSALRRTLIDQLGVAPSPQLEDLRDRLLRHDPTLDVVRSAVTVTARSAVAAPDFFGRADELRRLMDRYADAVNSRGNLVAVVGEPGIGKTCLLREFAAAAGGRGATVLSGRCLEGDWQPAYHTFVEAISGYAGSVDAQRLRAELGAGAGPLGQLVSRLHELCSDLPRAERLQPNEERLRLLDAVAGFVGGLSTRAPVVLNLDDLHWADPSTLMMLRHVARFASRYRVLIAVAYRAGEAGSELVEAFGALRTEIDMSTVQLRGLDRASTERLVNTVAGAPVSTAVVEAIMAETRGNPFFAREVARHLVEEGALRTGPDGMSVVGVLPDGVPEGVRQVLARRRAQLSPRANRFLDTAAGFDGSFPFAVVAGAAGLDDADALAVLDEVIHAGLVETAPVPERYQFIHALIRHAVYGDLNPSRRVRLHRRLAETLEGARAGSAAVATAAEIASQYHASAALPDADAGVGPALEAADHAEAAAAHDDAAAFLAVACALASPDDERLPAMRTRLGLALAWALRFDDAVEVARDAADRIAVERGPAAAAAYLAEVTTALSSADSAPHAWSLAAQGLRYVGERRDRVWASLVLHELDRREAEDPSFPGMILDIPERREALRILLETGGVADRVELARFAMAAVHGRRDRIPTDAAHDPSVRLFLLGDYSGALPLFDAEATTAHARGQLAREGYCRAAGARCHLALGDLDAGRAGLAEGADIAGRIGQGQWGWQRITLIGTLDALAHATDTGWPDVLAKLEEAYSSGNPAGRRLEAAATATAAKAAARLGRADEAMQWLARTLPALRRAPAWAMTYVRTLCDAVETLWLLGCLGQGYHPDLAALETAAREKAMPADFRFPMMDTRLALARLCALGGRYAEARSWFAESRAVLDAQGARPLRAIVDADEAVVELWAGRADSARALLASAVGQFEYLGMTGWVHRARRLVPA